MSAITPVGLIVLAKAPVPGRCKTRLCPPCSPAQAATLAEAAIVDTLAAAAATRAAHKLLVLDGTPGGWADDAFTVISQRGPGLAERLASAFADAGGPALLLGMDTPQITTALLQQALETLAGPDVDAVLGATPDGGYWAIGLSRPDARVFDSIPMSQPETCMAQRHRLAQLGMRTVELPALRDVDDFADAVAVAQLAPRTRFAAALRAVL